MSGSEAHETEVLVAPGKALRLADMIDAMVRELHAAPIDDSARSRFLRMYGATLVEVGSTLSDALLEELARLQMADVNEACSIDEARIVMTQLEGWLHGLIEAMVTGAVSVDLPANLSTDASN